MAKAFHFPMSATVAVNRGNGFWSLAWQRFRDDRVGVVSLVIVAAFFVVVFLSALGVIASGWNEEVAIPDAPPDLWGLLKPAPPMAMESAAQRAAQRMGKEPSLEPLLPSAVMDPLAETLARLRGESDVLPESRVVDPLAETLRTLGAGDELLTTTIEKRMSLPFGGDRWGRDVLTKTIKGSQTSIIVGLTAALLATFLGTLLGALAGYYGHRTDDALNWFYSVFNAIPYLLLILAVAAVLQQRGVVTVILILGLTGWTGVFRLVRAEYIKHRGREYVRAAHAFGVPNRRILFFHILPNVSHVVLVNVSILAVGFIKAEVILSFLGFGVAVDEVSWGSMLNDAHRELILGRWWELLAAGGAMALLVTAFSLLTDAMRDALDPKIRVAS
ncbi:MAG: ABC transporter permease [Proteobacteria bacterium]|nr:ABC transporter permease [Pseudomonadota bacterium]MCL2307745.1 ABC transporter permease [Pseudomonadota bacterium]